MSTGGSVLNIIGPKEKIIAFIKSKQFKLITEVCIDNPSTYTWEAEAGTLEVWD